MPRSQVPEPMLPNYEDLKSLLARYAAFDAEEAVHLDRIRSFVNERADCFERSNTTGHITGSSWIVDAQLTRVLLLHHGKLQKWLQPGGHADGDRDIRAVALREAREESGLSRLRFVSEEIFDADVHRIPPRRGEPEHFHFDVRFILEADPEEPTKVSSESLDIAWVTLAQVSSLTTERSIIRMVEKTALLASSGTRV
jgi:8-oxo-dGTP pyrophosphatase MutT (NUDIX family)